MNWISIPVKLKQLIQILNFNHIPLENIPNFNWTSFGIGVFYGRLLKDKNQI